MSAHHDRNLHVGILALQNAFITREQLVAAMNIWLADKSKTLIDILADQSVLAPDRRQLLEALAQVHLGQHDNDPARSLAALSSIDDAQQLFENVHDPDVQASLKHIRTTPPQLPLGAANDFSTVAPTSAAGSSRFRTSRSGCTPLRSC